jgi:predicted DNA-binding transcriptional regulator AlpA
VSRPTLDEIRTWPATVKIPQAATALGISKSHAYELARTGELPVKVLRVRGVCNVVTASLVAVLSADDGGDE